MDDMLCREVVHIRIGKTGIARKEKHIPRHLLIALQFVIA